MTALDGAVETDGRRRRGQDNRARIVAAMLESIRDGEISPSAEHIATRADVGLRTVFRHFKDMESLYREISGVIEGQLRAVAETPFKSSDWKGRIIELVDRRAIAFENAYPFKRASDAVRHRSRFLDADHDRLVMVLRAILVNLAPAPLTDDPLKLEILDLLLSFESWCRLRREQKLSVPEAVAVLRAAVQRVLDDVA